MWLKDIGKGLQNQLAQVSLLAVFRCQYLWTDFQKYYYKWKCRWIFCAPTHTYMHEHSAPHLPSPNWLLYWITRKRKLKQLRPSRHNWLCVVLDPTTEHFTPITCFRGQIFTSFIAASSTKINGSYIHTVIWLLRVDWNVDLFYRERRKMTDKEKILSSVKKSFFALLVLSFSSHSLAFFYFFILLHWCWMLIRPLLMQPQELIQVLNLPHGLFLIPNGIKLPDLYTTWAKYYFSYIDENPK